MGHFWSLSPLSAYLIALSVAILAIVLWHGSPLILATHLYSLSASKF